MKGTILESAAGHRHFVQLYDGTARLLARNVGAYLSDGLAQQETAIVVATPDHREAFCREMDRRGANPDRALNDGRLLLLDAEEMLGRFMMNGQPDWDLFDNSIGACVREVQSQASGRRLRAYGEMVGVLWAQGRFAAAMALEDYWNTVLDSTEFRLFSAYPIDVFGPAFHACDVDALMCSHSHVMPAEANGPLDSALDRAMGEILGSHAERLRDRIAKQSQPVWASTLPAEAKILWLRSNLGEEAEQILSRANKYYYASAA